MNELLLAGIAAGGGIVVGGLAYLLVRRRAPRTAAQEEVVPLEVLGEEMVLPAAGPPSSPQDMPFSVARAPVPVHAPRPILSAPAAGSRRGVRPTYDADDPPELPDSPIPTEWARRQVGPVEGGRMKGVCSGCGTNLSVSTARPLRIACPVCGRTRLLAA